jgi:hypothetical protein
MPIPASSAIADASSPDGLGPASQGPLPFEQLLRSNGGGIPLDPATAHRRIAADAATVLAALDRGQGPAAWRRAAFARRVEATRRHLAPIAAADVLAESFRRESFLANPLRPTPDAPRAAYAIRWLELVTGLHVPPWHAWMPQQPASHTS